MKDGVVEQIDSPDRIVLAPATDYVARFTEQVDGARVVRAQALMEPLDASPDTSLADEGQGVAADDTIQALARRLVDDRRDRLPVLDRDGQRIGWLPRSRALDVLLGSASDVRSVA